MEIRNVHLLFEQSGTFKNEFKNLGFNAYDYDIKNDYQQTNYVIDIFNQIDEEMHGVDSFLFAERITKEDLVMAFFPCIYFCEDNVMYFTGSVYNYRKKSDADKILAMRYRSELRQYFYNKVLELIYICESRNYRLIIENPYSPHHYWRYNFPKYPVVIDMDRTTRGDFYKKPTQFVFVNCEPETGKTSYQRPKEIRYVREAKPGRIAGECSAERSLISPDYAHNFICDYILGIASGNNIATLFDNETYH